MFHERVLVKGEEAQVDWMVLNLPWGTGYPLCTGVDCERAEEPAGFSGVTTAERQYFV